VNGFHLTEVLRLIKTQLKDSTNGKYEKKGTNLVSRTQIQPLRYRPLCKRENCATTASEGKGGRPAVEKLPSSGIRWGQGEKNLMRMG